MDTGRPTKSFADFAVIAFNPVLLIVMVQSLCFFLVEVFYRGEGIGGVRWVLFWFVLAVVLITRIGMELGEARAISLGLALTGVVWVYLLFIQTNFVFAAILLAIVWFTAHKLTANCTLVDDEDDASGQGLMLFLQQLQAQTPPQPPSQPQPIIAQKKTGPSGRPLPASTRKKVKKQTPGVWLLYYSMAAVPLFGIGQALLPADAAAARHHAFVYLFLYLGAGLGLLVSTSFLGLRRYLRQRYVTMPSKIARGWLQTGVVAIGIVLILALLLPRPGAREAWASLSYHVDHQLRRASDYAARFNPHGTGHGRSGDDTSSDGQKQNNLPSDSNQNTDNNGDGKGQGKQQSGGSGNGGSGGGGGQSSGGSSGQANGSGSGNDQQQQKKQPEPKPKQDQSQEDNGRSGASTKPSSSPPPPHSAFSWLRILFWLAIAVVLGWLCYRYRAMILAMLKNIRASIHAFIDLLRGLFKHQRANTPVGVGKVPVAAFRTFQNPFLTGGDRVWPPEQLIAYTYQGLQSWVLEQEAAHGSPRTPREFCRQLAGEMPEAADALEHLAFLYGHVAYGASLPPNYNLQHLRLLWDYMANPRPKLEIAEKAFA